MLHGAFRETKGSEIGTTEVIVHRRPPRVRNMQIPCWSLNWRLMAVPRLVPRHPDALSEEAVKMHRSHLFRSSPRLRHTLGAEKYRALFKSLPCFGYARLSRKAVAAGAIDLGHLLHCREIETCIPVTRDLQGTKTTARNAYVRAWLHHAPTISIPPGPFCGASPHPDHCI